MADHANVRLRGAEKLRGLGGRALIVERHHDSGAFALLERLNAAGQLMLIEPGRRRRLGNEISAKLRQQLRLTMGAAPKVENGHTASAEHELRELVGLSQSSIAKRLEHSQQHLLHEVVRGRWRSQMAKAIEPD